MSERTPIDLSGTFLPVNTPFDPTTGDVDIVAYRDNLSQWFEHPISGILTAGSTGESVYLDDEERRTLVAIGRDVAPEGRLVIAGTGSESTRHTILLTRQAADAGADAVLVSPPAFFKGAMTPAAITTHFTAVADASPVPVMIYQVPLRLSTLEFSTELIVALAQHPNIVGLKDSRGKLELTAEWVEACPDDFQVLVGSGAILEPALAAGATGGIVAVGLMAPADAARISVAFGEGLEDEAARLQEKIAPVHQQIVGGMGVPGVKAALDLLGMHGGDPRPPLSPAPPERVEEIRGILAAAGLLATADV
jgi:4-hydroxy-2-oxoglutarate aldolase